MPLGPETWSTKQLVGRHAEREHDMVDGWFMDVDGGSYIIISIRLMFQSDQC